MASLPSPASAAPTFTSSVAEPRERGRELGRAHGAEVARTVATYRALFSRRAGRPFDVAHWGARALATIGEVDPEAMAEIRGIAEGAGLPAEHVAAINARTELLAVADPTGEVECSTVVHLPDDGSDPVAVQTWDWYEPMSDGWFAWTIPYPDGRRVQTVTEYGVLAKIGVNDAGLGVMLNMLHHAGDDQRALGDDARIGFPVHLLARRLLERATTTAEAEALVAAVAAPATGPGFTASTSLTVVHARQRCADAHAHAHAASLELFPGGTGVVRPQPVTRGRLLVRTNHFVSAEGAPGDLVPSLSPGSMLRREALLERLATTGEGLGVDEVLGAMEHHDPAGPVCSHPDPSVDAVVRHATLATVHVDVTARRLGITVGGPCGAGVVPLAVA